MVITDNRNNTFVRFNQIQVGECFDFLGRVYMRTHLVYDGNPDKPVNVIALGNGDLDYFNGDIKVAPLNAHLIIEDQWFPDERDSYGDNY